MLFRSSQLDLQKTLTTLNGTIGDLKSTIGKLNSTSGTAGLLLNDTKLYNNLTATANKINLLIDDLKTNPKRPEDVCDRLPTCHESCSSDKTQWEDCHPTIFRLARVDDHGGGDAERHRRQQLIRNAKHWPDG